MDFEEEFKAAAADAVQACQRRNKATRTWSCGGNEIIGWQIDSESWGPEVEGTPGQGWWRERWGSRTYILGVDGAVWYEQFNGEDSHGSETYTGTTLDVMPDSWLVGNKGMPYSEWKAKIERVPYR